MEMPSEEKVKEWYNRGYASKGLELVRPSEAYPVFLDYLHVVKRKNLLDIACGTGFLLLEASKRGLRTYGVDISEEAIKISKNISPESEFIVSKGEELKFENKSFDYITCLGSLEHFLDMDKSLQEMKRVAKDDAKFCIMVPNSEFIYWKISKKYGTNQQELLERMLTLDQWKELFLKHNFKISNISQDKWHSKKLKVFKSINPISVIKTLLLKFAWMILPLRWTYCFIFILEKNIENE